MYKQITEKSVIINIHFQRVLNKSSNIHSSRQDDLPFLVFFFLGSFSLGFLNTFYSTDRIQFQFEIIPNVQRFFLKKKRAKFLYFQYFRFAAKKVNKQLKKTYLCSSCQNLSLNFQFGCTSNGTNITTFRGSPSRSSRHQEGRFITEATMNLPLFEISGLGFIKSFFGNERTIIFFRRWSSNGFGLFNNFGIFFQFFFIQI